MPTLSEGSIVEWEYTITSPFFWRIDDVIMQYDIPIKIVESKVEIPEYFIFKNQSQGFQRFTVDRTTKQGKIVLTSKTRSGWTVSKTEFNRDQIDFTTNITSCSGKNMPALEEEPYVNNIDNYRTLLKYEISATKFPNSHIKHYNNTWEDVTKSIYNSTNFGGQLKKTSYFSDDLLSITAKTDPLPKKVASIFQFVKSKIKWNGFNSIYTRDGVKKAYKEGVGNVAEINLILVAMLREVGLKANPILVSTRSHGIPIFPTTDGFNYVIAGVEVQNNVILLDATETYSIPNVLPLRDLNWKGRIVRESGSSTFINLFPKKHSVENTFINVNLNSDGSIENGFKRVSYNNLNALNIRKKYNALSKDELISKLEEKDNFEIVELKK